MRDGNAVWPVNAKSASERATMRKREEKGEVVGKRAQSGRDFV